MLSIHRPGLSSLLFALCAGCAGEPPAQRAPTDDSDSDISTPSSAQDHSLRLLTWNIRFLADGKDVNDATWSTDEARAAFVAQVLLDEAPDHQADLIVLNEAQNIEPQDELSSALCGTYPNFVRFLDGGDLTVEQDSGLMLFSKHPFQPLQLTDTDNYAPSLLAFTGCVDDDADDDHPQFWSEVGFKVFPYSDCSSWDCWADKGVGAVRVALGTTAEPINVAFTHLQASDEYWEDRVAQMADAEELIRSIPGWSEQRTFMIGDLNINGLGCSGAGCTRDGVGGEWMNHFNSGGFFGCGDSSCGEGDAHFVDAWGFGMPSEDQGRTYVGAAPVPMSDAGQRLDYVLHNVPSERVSCLQHMRVLRHWVDANGTPPTDHLPVWAEYNYQAPHCNPLEAAQVQHASSLDFEHAGTITYPQSVQWLRIDQAGTYSLAASDDVSYEVYLADDMSYPMDNFYEEQSRWGTVYKLYDPPYYIKVEARDDMFTGAYTFDVHRHGCGPNDCCALTPGDLQGTRADWTQGQVNDTARWFCFYTGVDDTGSFPNLTFRQEAVCTSEAASVKLEPELWTSNAQHEPGEQRPWNTYSWCDGLDCEDGQVENDAEAGTTRLDEGKYFVKLDPGEWPSTCWATMFFTTDLTYFYPHALTCHNETQGLFGEVGNDEIFYRLALNGTCTSSTSRQDYTYLADFDEDESATFGLYQAVGPRVFTGCLTMDLLEDDDGSPWFLVPQRSIPSLDNFRTADRYPVGPVYTGQQLWQDDKDADDASYFYQMTYTVTHEPLGVSWIPR